MVSDGNQGPLLLDPNAHGLFRYINFNAFFFFPQRNLFLSEPKGHFRFRLVFFFFFKTVCKHIDTNGKPLYNIIALDYSICFRNKILIFAKMYIVSHVRYWKAFKIQCTLCMCSMCVRTGVCKLINWYLLIISRLNANPTDTHVQLFVV